MVGVRRGPSDERTDRRRVSKTRLDHCAIGISDWERANGFWRDVVGAELVRLPRGLWAYRFGDQLLTVHGPGATPEPPHKVAPGASHVAFVWPGPIAEAVAHLADYGLALEQGPVVREATGRGHAQSVYFRDPDGSLVEFVSYARQETDS